MRNFICIWRDDRTGKNEMSKTFGMINTESHRIPELRDLLPFINQPRLCTFEQFVYVYARNKQIFLFRIRIAHV